MARTSLASQKITDAGTAVTYTAANVDGHTINGDGDQLLHVKNGSGGSINVTIETGETANGFAVADRVVAIPAGQERFIGRFRSSTFKRQPTEITDPGAVWVNFSAVTSVTVACLEV